MYYQAFYAFTLSSKLRDPELDLEGTDGSEPTLNVRLGQFIPDHYHVTFYPFASVITLLHIHYKKIGNLQTVLNLDTKPLYIVLYFISTCGEQNYKRVHHVIVVEYELAQP